MRIVVTGACGFIGSHLSRALRMQGHEVITTDLYEDPGPNHVAADVRNAVDLDQVVQSGTDIVVHLAAVAGVAPSLADPARYMSHNVEGTLQVLLACERAGVSRLVLASSSSVYGNCDHPVRENHPLQPLSPYAASKVAAEALALSWARRDLLEVVVVRPFTVYGPGQRPDMAISSFLRLMQEGKEVTLWPFIRDFTYIEDVVTGILGAITVSLQMSQGVFNLGSGRPVTAVRLVEAIEEATEQPMRVRWAAGRDGEPMRTHADSQRAREQLGFEGGTSLVSGLRRQSDGVRSEALTTTRLSAGNLIYR
jgi:nucleoside-diphosphate-sugar epimerase